MIHSNIYAIKTLNDVRLLLPALYSEASCKVYTAALTKVTRLTGKPLTHVLADEHTWFLFAQTIVWAGAFRGATPGDQKRAFDAWVKKIAASIKRAQNHVASPVLAAPQDAAWERLEAYTKDVENTFDADGVRVLPNMFSLSIANLRAQCGETHPALLDTDVVSKAIVACRADKSPSLRRSVSAFNKLIRNQNRHPVICDLLPPIPIGPLPALRDQPLDWSCFSAAFLRSRDRAIQRAIHPDRKRSDPFGGKLGKDPLEGRRRDGQNRKRKVRNPDAARKRHLNALSWLIRHAYPDRSLAYTLNGIEALLTVETVEQGVDRYVARAEASKTLKDPDKTSSGNSILSSLETLAKRNDLPDAVVWAIEDARYDRVDSYQAREMSLEREAFVKLIERDPSVARAIVSGPRRLMMEASESFDRWETLGVRARGEALHLSLGSTLMALQLARAVRSKNLNEMTTNGDDAELIRPLRESKPWIDISRSKVKNRRPIEGEIPDRQWHIIMSWLDDGLPRWCDLHGLDIETNIHLVPGPNGILSRQSFNRIWNRCVERLGIPGLQPHMMRHVAATLWLAANPGDYATVAAFLGDNRFGSHFADCIRRERPRPNDKWHMDEVVITIRGKKHWLWRAIDADGDVLDILVQTRRNAKAAKRFFQRLISQFGEPRVVITDKLRSYIKPVKTQAPNADHRAHKGLSNAIEVSHRPTRKREKIMGRFKSHRQAQRFLSAHDQINLIFRPRRYQLTATSYRHARNDAFSLWADYTAEMTA